MNYVSGWLLGLLMGGLLTAGFFMMRDKPLTPRETLHYMGVGVCKGHGRPTDEPVFSCEDGYQAVLPSYVPRGK